MKLHALFLLSVPAMVGAFTVVPSKSAFSKTQLHIDKHIADMIDQELYRQNHKKEFEEAWMQKNKPAILQRMDDAVSSSTIDALNSMDSDTVYNVRQQLRDQKLARANPQQYCADRCIATGYCDVFEDFFDFSPEEVVEFCQDCVLALDSEEPCDIPEAFFGQTEGFAP